MKHKYKDEWTFFQKQENIIRKYSYTTFCVYRSGGKTLEEIIEIAKTKRINTRGGRRKRTEKEKIRIREWYKQGGISMREIGEHYNLGGQSIWYIINNI